MILDCIRFVGACIVRIFDYLFYCVYKSTKASGNFRGQEENMSVVFFLTTIILPHIINLQIIFRKLGIIENLNIAIGNLNITEDDVLLVFSIVFSIIIYYIVYNIYVEKERLTEILETFKEKRILVMYLHEFGWSICSFGLGFMIGMLF